MSPFLRPVSLNETALRINWLHKALKALDFPIEEEEERSYTAGASTLKQVRALQAKLNIKFDDKFVVDQTTLEALWNELLKRGLSGKPNLFTVRGSVNDLNGEVVKSQALMALDVDLRGAAVYRTIKSIKDIEANGGFEYLGEGLSDSKGNYHIEFYSFQFTAAERKRADVIVFATNQNGEITGRSLLVNSEDYTEQGEVRKLDVVITKADERTEYEILMGKLLPFLEESKVKLIELILSNDQVKFTANELDEPESKIQIAVDAEGLRTGKKEDNNTDKTGTDKKKKQQTKTENKNSGERLLHELLYGIGRQGITLNWLVLYRKTDTDLKTAIEKSVQGKIIKKYDEKEVVLFLQLIHECAAAYILLYQNEDQSATLEKILSIALPEKQQQEAFVNAYRNFKNQTPANEENDHKIFWAEYLPAIKEFKERPELITRILLTQQLTILSGSHQPLIEELQTNREISSVIQLIELDESEWKKIIKKTGAPDSIDGQNEEEKINAYAEQIQSFLNAAYPTQKIEMLLRNQRLPIKDQNVLKGITTFLNNNSGFGFDTSCVHEYNEEIRSAAKEYYTEVKQELNRIQRIFQVSPTPEVMSILMEKDLNSAYSIYSIPKKSFVKMHSKELGGDLVAEMVYQRAEHISTLAAERSMKMYDLSHLAAPAFAYSASDREEALSVLQNQVSKRHNPNYSEIFGSPDICECEQCRSVYSAAAYFVDLLRFLWRGATNADGKSPLDMFAARRPDLLHLPLTCENTNTIIPYIDLVNEVMEYYTYHGSLNKDAAHDTGETTANELRANPQNFEPEAYRVLKNTVYPFSLPFHQPLDVIRTFSDYLKTERYEVMKGLQKDFSVKTNKAIDSEALRISEEEYSVLTLNNFNGDPDLDELSVAIPKPVRLLHQYFGYATAADLEKMSGTGVADGIHEFLRRAGITYTELVELIKTRFVNPFQDMLEFIEELFVNSTLKAPVIYSKLQQIKAGTLDPSTDPDIMLVLAGKMSPADFAAWIKQHFDDFDAIITLYQSNSSCDLNTTYLRTVQNIYAGVASSGITSKTWSKIHRFIRLWRKLGWKIHEVDLMIAALGENDISDDTISKLSYAALLNKEVKLPLNKLATFWGSIDTYGDHSLYKTLFLNKAVQRIDAAFIADKFGNYLTDNTQILQDHIPAILAAFRMSEDDLNAIIDAAIVVDNLVERKINPATDKLNIYNLSIIYRYTVLSKAMKLKVADLTLLTQLFSIAPFSNLSIPAPAVPPAAPFFEHILPADTLEFYKLGTQIKTAGFKPVVLQYIFNGILPADSTAGIVEDNIKQAIKDLRKAFSTIEQNYPATPSAPLTIDILRSNLLLSFKADVVNHLMGIITSRQSYHVITDKNLGIIIPDTLSPKISYTKASGRLVCTGVLSDAEMKTLQNLAIANLNFQKAVDELYKMPEDLIKENFSGVFAAANKILPQADLITLLNHPAQPGEKTPEEKLDFVYSSYLPLLKQKLHEDAIIQHVATLIELSEETTSVLIKNNIQPLIESIALEGFSAEYFSDLTWTTSAIKRIDKEINFSWGAAAPDLTVPANKFSVRWKSFVSPPSSGEYTLVVEVTEADEVFNLYLDDALILHKPAADIRTSWEVMVPLNAAQMYNLKIEYSETIGNAGISLSWKTATTAVEIVHAVSAFPTDAIQLFMTNIQLFHRAAKFIAGFKLIEGEVNHFITFKTDFDNIDFQALTPSNWQRINNYVQLRNAVPQTQASLIDVFVAANIASPAPSPAALTNLLYLATGWDFNTISFLVNSYFILTPVTFKNEIELAKIYTAVLFVSKTGLSAQTLGQWATPETDFDKLNATADLVKSTVKAKYEEEDWLKLAGDLSNKIRENQKQALISYLLTKQALINWGVKDADGLFEYFLIDVQMGVCMDTSRIVQANAAVQMFVNRCLLNLESETGTGVEKGVSPDAIDKERWEWTQFYRVWEVNRKIFLYPENWLEPEWRDDRSEFFREFESELIQNDITDSSVETAFRNYLTKLNGVANPDVCGTYQENYPDGTLKLLHVFGRTHNAPYQFFYRTCNEFYKWSAWEKVQVDIRMTEDGDNSGVQLMPVIWKSRLFIFWMEFTKITQNYEPVVTDTFNFFGAEFTKERKATVEEIAKMPLSDQKYWENFEIKLAWSENVKGKWIPKQVTKEFVSNVANMGGQFNLISDWRIQPFIDINNALVVKVLHTPYIYGFFYLTDIQSKIYSFDLNEQYSSTDYSDFFMEHKKQGTLDFKGLTYLKKSVDYRVLYSPQLWVSDFQTLNYPFFYKGYNRTYFVRAYDVIRNISMRDLDYVRKPEFHLPILIDTVQESNHIIPPGPIEGPFEFKSGVEFINSVPDTLRITGDPGTRENINTIQTLSGKTASNMFSMETTETRNFTVNKISGLQQTTEIGNMATLDNAFSGITGMSSKYHPNYLTKQLEFHTFYHPFSSQFVTNLNLFGIKGLMESDTFLNLLSQPFFNDYGAVFTSNYNPDFSLVKKAPMSPPPLNDYKPGEAYTYYKENICFDVYGTNSIYNWELFFHAPLYIATRLSKNGKYKEAMKWFHYIFDPTTDENPPPGKETSRYWKVLPFKTTPAQTLEQWFGSIGLGPNTNPATENSIVAEWRNFPFKPFVVARNRPIAFMKNVVIKYVDNLREWGDSLFRAFTRESVNEALQLYVMANHILGPRPEFVPKRGKIKAETYASLENKWDDFSNALVEMENIFPYSGSIPVGPGTTSPSLLGIGQALYFCIPDNDKLIEQWDTVTDRLYKIRHCMDIDGVERQLALFSPPIDPALLINAAAQGISLGSILSDLSSPPPVYRFNYLMQKANEFCSDVKSLGSTLLSVLEKKDSEELGRLRALHETDMLDKMTAIKERQVLDGRVNKENLLKSRAIAVLKLQHYNAKMSEEMPDIPAPPTIGADVNSESQLPVDTSIANVVLDLDESLVSTNDSGIKLIPKEKEEFDRLKDALHSQNTASGLEMLASIFHAIPTGSIDVKPIGIGIGMIWGPEFIGRVSSAVAKAYQIDASNNTFDAAKASKTAAYIRREQDWSLQANLAAKEIIQLDKQITSADIKIQIAQKELFNHNKQIEHSKQVELFLKDKFTNKELYQWMKEQLFSVYKLSFNMAYDMAKKVEKCYRNELGNEITSFIQYGYWDNSMQGLCAGEKLQLALRQLEKSYLEENKRELELTKSVSMALLNPLALQELRTTGKCFLTIPEELYDLDYQGHYFRRIKSVSLSLPCIAGPYTTVNCSLRLLKNTIRINTLLSDSGAYEHNNDEGIWTDDVNRFRESNIPVTAIATSTGQHDSGMFEFNFRDERYLPFEGAGALSEWKIELTRDIALRQFDYSTIADVIFHINYTAREDAGLFKESAVTYLKDFLTNVAELSTQPLMQMFSMKHEFSTEWHKFLIPSIPGSDQLLSITLQKEHFPFFTKDRAINIKKVEVLLHAGRTGDYKMILEATDLSSNAITSAEILMPESATYGNMQKSTLTAITPGANIEDLDVFKKITLKFKHTSDANYHSIDTDPEEISDLFMVFHYALG